MSIRHFALQRPRMPPGRTGGLPRAQYIPEARRRSPAVLFPALSQFCRVRSNLLQIFIGILRPWLFPKGAQAVGPPGLQSNPQPAYLCRAGIDTDFYFVQAEDPEIAVQRIVELVKIRIPARFGFDPIRGIQVLCPMNRGGVGARSLNIELQATLNPAGEQKVLRFGWIFAPGDKVMQTQNDYDKEVYNGDIGYVDEVDLDVGELVASFDGRAVSYAFGELDTLVPAYAATIHKRQGSEYPAVVIPVMTQHYPMLQRNLLYTGVTRGKKLVVLVGQKKAVAIAVRNVSGAGSNGSQRMHRHFSV